MNFKQFFLNEMPLGTYKVRLSRPEDNIGFYSKNVSGYFSQQDRAIITHPSTVKKLEQLLSKHQFKFNIILYESNETDFNSLKKDVIKYLELNKIPWQDHITFAKNGSSGEPLTVWMILHTIGHALVPDNDATITNILKGFYRENYLVDCQEQGVTPMNMVEFLKHYFMFKSAQTPYLDLKGTNDIVELMFELIAEYIWNGTIRIQKGLMYPYEAQQMKGELERTIFNYLKNAVGDVILDHYV